jgi:trans-aconitate 2-methyltransferase
MLPTFVDRVAIAVARIAYPQESPTIITERVRYLRLLPERLNNATLISRMKRAGLALLQDQEWPGASLMKPRHRLLVFKRLDFNASRSLIRSHQTSHQKYPQALR